jgi:hypothetical protein
MKLGNKAVELCIASQGRRTQDLGNGSREKLLKQTLCSKDTELTDIYRFHMKHFSICLGLPNLLSNRNQQLFPYR